MMTTLIYRGLNYVQHKEHKENKECVQLTYRRNNYNTCRSKARSDQKYELAYRGQFYDQ